MFGLPIETALLVFGFPLFWIMYTIGFVYVSREWHREEQGDDEES